MGTTFTISYSAIALGVGFSAAVGILFGWSPARKASNLRPHRTRCAVCEPEEEFS